MSDGDKAVGPTEVFFFSYWLVKSETKRQEDAAREEVVTEHSLYQILDFFEDDTPVDHEAPQNGQDRKKAVV